MEHVKAIVMKFVMLAVVLGIILAAIFDFGFWDSMVIALVLTLIAYVLGDLMVFRGAADPAEQNKRNMMATIGDAILAFTVIWLMGMAMGGENILWASIISAVVIAGGEWFFHKYLDKAVFGYDHAAERTTT